MYNFRSPMEHIKLLLTFINLILGCSIVMFLLSRYRIYGGCIQFRRMSFYSLVYNILLTAALISKYVDLNIPVLSPVKSHSLYEIVSGILFTLMLFLMTGTQFRIRLDFAGTPPSDRIPHKAGLYSILIAAGLSVGIVTHFLKMPVSQFIMESTGDFVFLTELVLLVLLFRDSMRDKDRRKKRLSGAYSLLFLIRYPLILIMFLIPDPLKFFSSMIILFYFNIIPVLWTLFVFRKGTLAEKSGTPVDFPPNITERERDIIKLILNGKSNGEIEDILCISPHTVKNHLYNIYRKLGIRNRYALISLYSKPSESASSRP